MKKNKNDHTGISINVLTQQAQPLVCGWGSCGVSFSLTSMRSSLFALSVVLSMPGNAAATLLKSCENIMSTNNI